MFTPTKLATASGIGQMHKESLAYLRLEFSQLVGVEGPGQTVARQPISSPRLEYFAESVELKEG